MKSLGVQRSAVLSVSGSENPQWEEQNQAQHFSSMKMGTQPTYWTTITQIDLLYIKPAGHHMQTPVAH